MKRNVLFLLLFLAAILLSGCLPGDGTNTSDKPAGFWWGIWHGAIAPISFIISLFKENVGIYELANNGWPYNLAFLIAISGSSGGTVHFSKKRDKK